MKKTISILAIIAMLMLLLATSVNAATTYSVTATGKSEVQQGEEVTLTIDTGTPVKAATFNITYESDKLKYISNNIDEDATNATAGNIIASYVNTSTAKQSFNVVFKVVGEVDDEFTVTVTPKTLATEVGDENEGEIASATWTGKIIATPGETVVPTSTPDSTDTDTDTSTPSGKKPTSYPKTGLNTAYIYVAGIVLVAICGVAIVNKRMK